MGAPARPLLAGAGILREVRPLGRGLGGVVGVALPAPLFLALALPESASLLEDPCTADVGAAGIAYRGLVRISMGTALFEEVAFRGVLFGAWANAYGLRSAILGSHVTFGLWHITPTLELLQGSDRFGGPVFLALGVLGSVVATFLRGLFFAWLRWRTRGVSGPFITHWLINAPAALVAFLAGGL